MVLSRLSLLCACAAILSKCNGSTTQGNIGADGGIRNLAPAVNVALPRTFFAGSVKNVLTDLVAAEVNEFNFLTGMVTGSSVVYTFDVAKAGTYEVSYGLVGFPQPGQEGNLVMGFLKGRRTCPPTGTEGLASVEKFTTGTWDVAANYVATPIVLEAGLNQEYTLCFERAAYVNLNYICIGLKCNIKGSIDASVPLVEAEVMVPAASDECQQYNVPQNVKQGSCIQVLCAPEYISLGTPFHMIVRYCNSHARKWSMAFNLWDDTLKAYVANIGTGVDFDYTVAMLADETTMSPAMVPTLPPTMTPSMIGTPNEVNGPDGNRCGEYTFEVILSPQTVDKTAILIWQFQMKPVWYENDDEMMDIFPNLIGQSDYFNQPKFLPQDYAMPLRDCPVIPTRNFEKQNIELLNMIRFPEKPPCLTPGAAFSMFIDVHIESLDIVDVRANLQTGSGVDKYLGATDVFIAESNNYNVKKSTAKAYWTRFTLMYSKAFTKLITPVDNVYLVAFMVPSGTVYDATQGGWQIVEREFNLLIEQCVV